MFSAPTIKLFSHPVEGRIEIRLGYAPRVRYAATLWRIKYNGDLSQLKDGQFVAVIGMQGNALIISTEAII
jgi:membrane protein implicated in regulation of membrane protease activity